MDKLQRILAHPRVALTKFRRNCFVYQRRRLRGLHRVLDRTHPVERHDVDACRACRANTTDTSRRRAVGVRERDFRCTRRSQLVPVTMPKSPYACRARVDNDRAHGIGVDRALDEYVRRGAFAPDADRCAVSLVRRLELDGWRLVASQVPIAARHFGSAIDLLCINGHRLAVVEVKASRHRQRMRCYTASSRIVRDAEQVRRLAAALRTDVGVDVDATLLVRVALGRVAVWSV